MDLPTQTHLKTLRGLLDFRLAELRANVHVGRRGQAAEADRERRDRVEKQEVVAALHRLDAGVYGDCSDCGEPIALQRLLVQPHQSGGLGFRRVLRGRGSDAGRGGAA